MKKLLSPSVLSEAGSMIASNPYNPDRSLSFVDMIIRELEKLNRLGRLSPVVYSRAVDLARVQTKILNKIYKGRARNLEQAVAFILRQLH